MSESQKAALRSALTTFLSALLLAIPVEKVADGTFTLTAPLVFAAALAGARTLLAALDPKQPLYGRGSAPAEGPAE